jgi:hypothetical protein
MTDKKSLNYLSPSAAPHSAISSILEGGLISKKDLFFLLRPGVGQYRSRTVRQFFTDDRLRRCGIHPAEFRRIRVFPAEATAVIREDLRQMKFI